MANSFHRDLIGDNIHVVSTITYADLAARDADTAFNTNSANVNKLVRVDSPSINYYILTSNTPTWATFMGPENPTLADILSNGNMSGGTQIDMDTAKIIDLADPTDLQDAATKNYVDSQIGGDPTIYTGDGTITSTTRTVSGETNAILNMMFYNTNAATFTTRGIVDVSPASTIMGHATGDGAGAVTGDQAISIQGTGMFITDSINSRGLQYISDYSANYVNRSLVDKAYVDAIPTVFNSGGTINDTYSIQVDDQEEWELQATTGTAGNYYRIFFNDNGIQIQRFLGGVPNKNLCI